MISLGSSILFVDGGYAQKHFCPPFSCDRNKAVRSALAQLVWSLLMRPSVLKHKSCKLVSTLLASVSYRPPPTSEGGGEGEVDHGKFLERYGMAWYLSYGTVSTITEFLEQPLWAVFASLCTYPSHRSLAACTVCTIEPRAHRQVPSYDCKDRCPAVIPVGGLSPTVISPSSLARVPTWVGIIYD